MTADQSTIAIVIVAVLTGVMLLANELVLWFWYGDDAPNLRERLHHGHHARGWVHITHMWNGVRDGIRSIAELPIGVHYSGGEIKRG